jgi:DNA-binding FadR family transcriptional regulator
VLAQQFGVSRTVVREAIARLKHEGVVEPRQGSGVFVTEQAGIKPLRIDYTEVSSPDAAADRRAAPRHRGRGAQAAKRRSEDLQGHRGGAGADRGRCGGTVMAADVAFHRALAQATRNPYFIKTLEFLSQYLEAATAVTRGNEARMRISRARCAKNMRPSSRPFAPVMKWRPAMPPRRTCSMRHGAEPGTVLNRDVRRMAANELNALNVLNDL